MKTTKEEKRNTLGVKETENKKHSLELDATVTFRIKNEDLKTLQQNAKNSNRTVSNYILNLIKTN
jgi:uncharacterized protein (DUF1778 family)